MERVLALYAGRAFLGGRGVAFKVRTEAAASLNRSPYSTVVLDFAGVRGVSHSFADELLSPLADVLGAQVPERITITNCDGQVEGELRSVAAMHGLPFPSVRREANQSERYAFA
ncbi:STAS-like domain-containing protein [Roseomonas sp. KE0001]|uniref:STAS-like domain-containing protein n=1 Tax=Roseomonas sp. KE0001 TaxID=2479201 RepID=UPI0018DF411D|nr:STAS-like domain-containing protein [Roseomonas sp. KE0001]MBI0432213.1 DUF4325 domain-containing protein [Roseomonas sp. KE0001]